MNNFKIGDKVIMKDHITGEDIQKLGIDHDMINDMKGKVFIIENAWVDDQEINVIEFKDNEFVWENRWFEYANLVPDELFEIE